jgi:NAD(P)-dependent dehydrogenase (short-subunit alcohol dehydrogenase family)
MALEQKKVVVVGGSSGIGLAAARDLARAGAKVTIASSRSKTLADAKALSPELETRKVDVRDPEAVVELFKSIGEFDHLVVSAANAVFGNFLQAELGKLQEFLDTKFWGACRVVHAAAPKISKTGTITLVSGAASHRGTGGLAIGSAINAALEALGRSLSLELSPIRVNTIAPGLIDTPVWDELVSPEEKRTIFNESAAKLPTKRIGRPEDIAHAIRFVIENTYMTGQVVITDGGYLQV